jgi:hypothetical protein
MDGSQGDELINNIISEWIDSLSGEDKGGITKDKSDICRSISLFGEISVRGELIGPSTSIIHFTARSERALIIFLF